MAGTADPITVADPGNTWTDVLVAGPAWSSGTPTTTISVYMAGLAGSEAVLADAVTALAPSLPEVGAMLHAMAAAEAVCNVDFQLVSSQADADLVWAMLDDTDSFGALGWAYYPGQAPNLVNGDEQSLVTANQEGYVLGDPSDPAFLAPGSYDLVTFTHELGHALGLNHPHETPDAFPGVTGPFGDLGDFDMNQGVYTTMSYNTGWATGPQGLSPSVAWGYEAGYMALDIAALQHLYGANTSYHTGADTYVLPSANAAGTGYLCIWDAGGVDRIVGGDLGNLIDLRAATLQVAAGGGGWVSYATGIHGGFTIANGVVIENAVGGDGSDQLFGNDAGNRLSAEGGTDTLLGYGGDDILRGGEGNDLMRGGALDDVVKGNDDNDNLFGDAGNDALDGGQGSDRLTGGAGQDTLRGGEGADRFLFNALSDSAVDATRDRVETFQRDLDLIVVNAIDAVAGGADDAFVLDAGGGFAAGEIRQVVSAAGLVLQFNVDGDATPEMTLLLAGVAAPLLATDFVL